MAEYWVASKKHYCKVCACWISGHKNNILMHEQGDAHKRAVFNQLKEARLREAGRQKEESKVLDQIKAIEAAAAASSAAAGDADAFKRKEEWVVCHQNVHVSA